MNNAKRIICPHCLGRETLLEGGGLPPIRRKTCRCCGGRGWMVIVPAIRRRPLGAQTAKAH